jgi:hypothetical protein
MWMFQFRHLDPLLHPYFAAGTENAADIEFDRLWRQTLQPTAEKLLRACLQEELDREDLLVQVGMNLSTDLRARREQKRYTLSNVCAHTRAIARRLFVDYVRDRKRVWRRLKQRALTALQTHSELDLWETEEGTVAGLRARKRASGQTSQAQEFLEGDYETFRERQLRNQSPAEIAGKDQALLPELILAVFTWIKIPLHINILTFHLVQLLCLEDITLVPLEDTERDSDERIEALLDRLEREGLLREFGQFVSQARISRCERGAISLNQERNFILDSLQIPLTEFATCLDFPPASPEHFQRFLQVVWRQLPLTDAQIADALEIEAPTAMARVQKVANCRMTALHRKWRDWPKGKR